MDSFAPLAPYHCSAEWHFTRMTGRGAQYAGPIHSLALHLSAKTGIFSASVSRIAKYFDANEKSARAAIHLLTDFEFFEFLRAEPGDTTTYKPIKHRDWAEKHPGKCCAKEIVPPWWGEGYDPLGKLLHGISGGKFRPFTNLIKGMRNTMRGTELNDAQVTQEIATLFRTFIAERRPVGRQWNRGLAGDFIKLLRNHRVT